MTISTAKFNRCIDLLGTRDEAAAAIGVSPRTLQRLRAGTYEVSAHNQAALANALLDKGQRCIWLAQQLLEEQEPAAS
jgi:post-segregation antitoxin (ccd killing protein)